MKWLEMPGTVQEQLPPIFNGQVVNGEIQPPEVDHFQPKQQGPLVEIVANCFLLGGAERVGSILSAALVRHGWTVRLINVGARYGVDCGLVDSLCKNGVGYVESSNPTLMGVATIWWGFPFEFKNRSIPGSIWVAHSSGAPVMETYSKCVEKDLVHTPVAVSERASDIMLGVYEKSATVIPNGIEPPDFRKTNLRGSKDDPFVLGYLGRYAPEKGVFLAIDAVQYLPENVRLRCYGYRGLKEKALSFAQEIGVGDRVDICGVASQERAFNDFDALIICSDYEGHPMVSIEAAMMGCPIVYGNDLGDLAKQYPHMDRGISVCRNPRSIASGVKALVESPELCQSLSMAAMDYARSEFTADRQAQRYSDVIEEISGVRP
jgi:glycosyltransferase involved in cell wall biosynthesis